MGQEIITVEVRCRWCGNIYCVKVRKSDFEKYCNGDMRASDFYYLTSAERELFISQTCDNCWQRMFSEDDQECCKY